MHSAVSLSLSHGASSPLGSTFCSCPVLFAWLSRSPGSRCTWMPPRIVFSLLCWTSSLCWMDSQRNLPAGDSRQRLCLRHSLQCRVLQSPDKRHAESAMLILSSCHDANKHSLKFSVVSFLCISTSSLICRGWMLVVYPVLPPVFAAGPCCYNCFLYMLCCSHHSQLQNWIGHQLVSRPQLRTHGATPLLVSARSCAELQGL